MARTDKIRLEPKARAFVRHLYRETGGRPMAWRMLHGMRPRPRRLPWRSIAVGARWRVDVSSA